MSTYSFDYHVLWFQIFIWYTTWFNGKISTFSVNFADISPGECYQTMCRKLHVCFIYTLFQFSNIIYFPSYNQLHYSLSAVQIIHPNSDSKNQRTVLIFLVKFIHGNLINFTVCRNHIVFPILMESISIGRTAVVVYQFCVILSVFPAEFQEISVSFSVTDHDYRFFPGFPAPDCMENSIFSGYS